MITMDKELRDKWVAALRSGNYNQGSGQLRTMVGFCCLGVLADVIDPTWEEHEYLAGSKQYTWKGRTSFLPYADYNEPAPPYSAQLTATMQFVLSGKNDRGDTFETIADFIEGKEAVVAA